MKRLHLTLLLILLSVFPQLAAAAQEMPWEQKLPFENLTVKYSLTGMEEGSETIYIKEYGQMSATYHTAVTSMMGMKMESQTVEIEDPEWIYSFDLVERIGQKTRNPKFYMQEEFEKMPAADQQAVLANSEKLGGNFMQTMGGVIEEKAAQIMGFDCDKVSVMGATTYTIHNTPVLMKMESSVMGLKINQEATSIDKGKVDDKVFSFPEGIEPVYDDQADAMMREIAQKTLNWLKDPEAAQADMPAMGPGSFPGSQQISPEDQQLMKQAEEMMQGFKGLFGN